MPVSSGHCKGKKIRFYSKSFALDKIQRSVNEFETYMFKVP